MRRSVVLLALVSALAGVATFGTAHANSYCNSSLVIFSYTSVDVPDNPSGVSGTRGGPAINENAGSCAIDNSDEIYDTRFLNPGTNSITVRDVAQLDASVASLPGVINGLGFDNLAITLTRSSTTGGLGTAYDSPLLYLKDGFAAVGSVSVVVTLPDGRTDTTTYHTAGA